MAASARGRSGGRGRRPASLTPQLDQPAGGRRTPVILYAIFFASGFSALVFETLWFRQAGLAFGSSVWASSLVLAGFMGGLAIGNLAASRYGARVAQPFRVYAAAEAAIAITGAGLVYLLPAVGSIFAAWLWPLMELGWLLNGFRFFAAFVLLLIPSTAMGVTLPLLATSLTTYDSRFGTVLGRLYGWNTMGAVAGVLTCETILIGRFGIRGTSLVAATLNLLVAGIAWRLSPVPQVPAAPTPDRTTPDLRDPREPIGLRRWLAGAFLAGFCLLALEVVWFRMLLLVVHGHSVAFAIMLAVVLAGIALGGLAAGTW